MDLANICRICLNKNVQHVVKSPQLQEVYEKLTTIPFQSDMRPLAVCYICYAQLRASLRFKLKCLRAEQLLAQMLDQRPAGDEELDSALTDRLLHPLTITELDPISIDIVQDTDSNKDPVHITYNCDVKFEEQKTQELPEIVITLKSEPYKEETPSDQGNDVHTRQEESPSKPNAVKNIKKQRNVLKKDSIAKEEEVKSKSIRIQDIKNDTDDQSSSINSKTCETGKFACSICQKSFSTKSILKDHTMTHTGEKPHVCNVCKKSFTQKSALNTHTRMHTGDQPYVCDVCNKRFYHKKGLISHIRIKHTGERPYVCEICTKSFSLKCTLMKHVKRHTSDGKCYVCNICGLSYYYKYELKRHSRVHTGGVKRHMCNFCGKFFAEKCNLVIHSRIHTGERPYKCSECDKSFCISSNLKAHARVHATYKPHICNICKKSFYEKRDLLSHTFVHTGEKPYSCNVCKKGYNAKSSFKSHSCVQRPIKEYNCDQCKQKFNSKSQFKYHVCGKELSDQTITNPNICNVCEKVFADRSSLTRHSRTHSSERPHVCDVCKKGFKERSGLRRHLRVHLPPNL